MQKQTKKKKKTSLPLHLCVSSLTCVSTTLCLHHIISVSLKLFFPPALCLSIYLSLCFYNSSSLNWSVSSSLFLFNLMAAHLSISSLVRVSTSFSLHHSISLCLQLFWPQALCLCIPLSFVSQYLLLFIGLRIHIFLS
jgi:hypothetical protein